MKEQERFTPFSLRTAGEIKEMTEPDLPDIQFFKNTSFTAAFIRENALDDSFQEWVFSPGMLFNDREKWWGDLTERDHPHEGLDICLHRDQENRIVRLDGNTKIPAFYAGKVVRIFNDFLGKTIITEYTPPRYETGRLYILYGHTEPFSGLHPGRDVKKGESIATISDRRRSQAGIAPHLHISLAWAPAILPHNQLDWRNIGDATLMTLLDPLHVLDGSYHVSTHSKQKKF